MHDLAHASVISMYSGILFIDCYHSENTQSHVQSSADSSLVKTLGKQAGLASMSSHMVQVDHR